MNTPCCFSRSASRIVTIVASVTTMLGSRSPATSTPLSAPPSAPTPTAASIAMGHGNFTAAARPAHVPHTAKSEPMEMSICRAMITSATPHASTSLGAAAVSRERSGCGSKKFGAKTASSSSITPSATATESSRKWHFTECLREK